MSLGCWETCARRRHDTLLNRYLVATGSTARLSPAFREAYWLAGASNALAGALLHHLQTLTAASSSPAARYDAQRAASSWMRVLRRAHRVWS
jgi:hypothetical protein